MNQDIWALGQIGDNRALPTLKRLHTGNKCDHDVDLCQYELEKAIDQVESGINITRPVWYWFVIPDSQKLEQIIYK
jgi:hypothetical protein